VKTQIIITVEKIQGNCPIYKIGDKIKYASSAIECLKNTDCSIIVKEWKEFKKLKSEDFKQNMKTPILIDGRRICNPE